MPSAGIRGAGPATGPGMPRRVRARVEVIVLPNPKRGKSSVIGRVVSGDLPSGLVVFLDNLGNAKPGRIIECNDLVINTSKRGRFYAICLG